VDDDPVVLGVAPVEDDRVAIDAANRELGLALRDDDPARIRSAVDENRVAGSRRVDGGLHRGRVLRNANDAAASAKPACRRRSDEQRDREQRRNDPIHAGVDTAKATVGFRSDGRAASV